ncbi:MAG: carbohydrate porin [Acetobacter sp.]|jgi:porin
MFSRSWFIIVVSGVLAGGISQAQAAVTPLSTDILRSGVPLPPPVVSKPAPERDFSSDLLGNAWGSRDWLADRGIELVLYDTEEAWGAVAGSLPSGGTYDGVTALALSLDSWPMFGWRGGLFHISALQIRSGLLSGRYPALLNGFSGYSVGRSTRLFELWYGQSFLKYSVDIRMGVIDPDTEFLVSDNASLFLNASFGWPLSTSNNLYAGGPSWPFSSPAVRVKWTPSKAWTLMSIVADDNPTGSSFYSRTTPLQNDPSGLLFSTGAGALFMEEIHYHVDLGKIASGENAPSLPGTWKVGFLYDSGSFPDRRYDAQGHLLASPESSGIPRYHRGDWTWYAVIDQMIWRQSRGSAKTISFFARPLVSRSSHSAFDLEMESGLTFDGLVPGRTDDTIGVAWGASFYSRDAIRNVQDQDRMGAAIPYQLKPEQHIEITYQAALTPYLILQPDLQYFLHPGGISRNTDTGHVMSHELIVGVNMTVTL